MKPAAVAAVALTAWTFAASSPAQTWTEPRSKVSFATERDGMALLGGGLRVKKIIFTFKAYAVGLYVSKEALAGPLAAYAGKPVSDDLRHQLVAGDFPKELVLHFLRNLSQGKIQGAMEEALEGADPAALKQFISYFPEVKEGEECVLRWGPGGTLESTMAGAVKPPIANRNLAERLFALYVGPTPLQDDFKADMLARVPEVLKAR
jgi:Chalcone isomerase-like